MNEIERELNKENFDKKRTAASAYKKVGSPRKCTLPYEMMDRKARKEYMAASECTTFKLQPMSLKEFKEVPADKQMELLKWYGEKYGWNAQGIASALGTTYTTGTKLLEKYMLKNMFKARMKEATDEQKKMYIFNRQKLAAERYNASQQPERPRQQFTQGETEKPAQSIQQPNKELFTVTMDKNEFGAILERRLVGIAHSLDRGEVYAVKLSIIQLGHQEDCPSDVMQA